jgi:hypothetical protein
MATGKKRNNLQMDDGQSFMDAWASAALTYTVASNLSFQRNIDENGEHPIGVYYGTAAIAATLTALINAPSGTIIFDLQAHTTVEKTGAVGTSTWVTSAARA